MDIEEIQLKRYKLEQLILTAVEQFSIETKIQVTSIEVTEFETVSGPLNPLEIGVVLRFPHARG